MSNQGVFSRLTSVNKWPDATEKAKDIEIKSNYIKASLSWWANDFQSNFVPPPPRPPFLEELATDGLTTCDLCGWAWSEKSFYPPEGQVEASNDFMWIMLLIIVSFSSAVVGAIVMITILKYRRNNSIRAFAMRNIGIKNPDFSPEQMHSSQKHQPNDMKNGARTNIDLKFFMEDNIENDEAFYATLDDQDSINSENLTTYPKLSSKNSEHEAPMFSSAPSSAYYSDMSNPPEKQYECIDNFATFEKSDYNRSTTATANTGIGSSFITLNNNNNVVTNRLSAISENNFSSHNRDLNSDYV